MYTFISPRMNFGTSWISHWSQSNSFLQKVISQWSIWRNCSAKCNLWGYWTEGEISMQMAIIDHPSEHRVMSAEWYLSSSISALSNKYTVQVICSGIQQLMDMGLPLNLGVIPGHYLNHPIHYLSHNGLTSL